jgi:hypothetical protein
MVGIAHDDPATREKKEERHRGSSETVIETESGTETETESESGTG